MVRRLAAQAMTVLLMLVGLVFATAPGASASMYWVELEGVTPVAMTAVGSVGGWCTENTYVRACFNAEPSPEVFSAKDQERDGASAGVYVDVLDTGRRFACYHSFGAGEVGRCMANIGEGNTVCIYTLKWDRSIGDVPVYDRESRFCLPA